MNKEKGFTLIELLAVIVILAIIALISTPIIIGVIEKARKGAFEDSAYGVLDAGKIYFTERLGDTNAFSKTTFDFSESVNDLKIAGEKPAGGLLSLDDTGRSALAIWDKDKKWCAVKGYDEEKITIREYQDECSLPMNAAQYILSKGIVTTGQGLYKDTTSEGGYVYKGKEPNNLAIFSGNCYSIMRVEDTDEIKLIYEGKASGNKCNRYTSTGTIGRYPWNNSNSTNCFLEDSNMKNVLISLSKGNTVGTLTLDNLDKIASHDWYIGAIDEKAGQTIEEDLLQQQTKKSSGSNWPASPPYVYNSKVALIYATDFVKGSLNTNCTSVYSASQKSDGTNYNCILDNYLYKTFSWYIQTVQTNSNSVIVLDTNFNIGYNIMGTIETRPTFYLISDTKAKGTGTSSDPYIIE